ncbi:MAG: HEAT repeat domain-containing protein [Deltaproteobacteria bacterium]|nr:HEAT repeat domain-containing protein [Deltaproteobacteria bacterium]
MNHLPALLMPALPPTAAAKEDLQEARAAVMDVVQGRSVSAALACLEFLGAGGTACDALTPHALGADARVRRNVAEVFARFAERPHKEALLALATDADVSLRVAAARGFGHAKLDHVGLRLLLRDKASGVRREAARALGRLKPADAGKAVLEAAEAEAEPEVREAMLVAAAAAPFPGLVGRLERLLGHSPESTRMAAARALCLLGAPSGLAVAREKLDSKSRCDRRDGVTLLDGAPLKAAGPLLAPLLKAPVQDMNLAAPAARVLAQAGDAKALEWLVVQAHEARGADAGPLLDAVEALKVADEDRKRILRSKPILP